MIHQWERPLRKRPLREGAAGIFERGGKAAVAAEVAEETVRDLRQDRRAGRHPGRHQRFFVTKAQALDRQVRRGMIERNHPKLSVGAQCRLLSISRSSFYSAPRGEPVLNLDLMLLIDKQFLDTPFYGVRQMSWHLQNECHAVNEKRIRRPDRRQLRDRCRHGRHEIRTGPLSGGGLVAGNPARILRKGIEVGEYGRFLTADATESILAEAGLA